MDEIYKAFSFMCSNSVRCGNVILKEVNKTWINAWSYDRNSRRKMRKIIRRIKSWKEKGSKEIGNTRSSDSIRGVMTGIGGGR